MMKLAMLRGRCACGIDHNLHEAVHSRNLAAVRFLLERGVTESINELCCGQRPLHKAICMTRCVGDIGYEMSRLLLENGALLDAVNSETPLHEAAACASPVAVALLLEYGADPDATNGNGQTALHVICRATFFSSSQFQDQTVEALLRHGADPSKRDAVGFLPSDYAGCPVLPCFEHHGEDLHARLARAERWWARRSVMLLRKRGSESHIVCKLPDSLFKAVVDFV